MSEDPTRNLNEAKLDRLLSIVERILSDVETLKSDVEALKADNQELKQRLLALEDRVDARLRETRPIWEAVLLRLDKIEIEVKKNQAEVRLLAGDIIDIRVREMDREKRISDLEQRPS